MAKGRSWAAMVGLIAVALLAVACGSSDSGSGDPGSGGSGSASGTEESSSTGDDEGGWRTLEVVDVEGQSFTFAELEGRPVFVENFATWCPTCRDQLGRTQDAAEALGDDAVVVVLSVETDLSSDAVAEYAEDNGFSAMRFAVMSEEMLAAMAETFGTSAVNPPSTPHVVIGADGTVGEMETGSISAADIEQAVRAAS